MLHKTPGIVFKYFKYGDSSIIVKILTTKFGLQTYIVNGVRSKRSKNKIALYQPLTQLDLVVYHNPTKDINRISEIKCSQPYHSIHENMQKTAVAIFLAEMLYKCIKDEGEIEDLFNFISSSIVLFDNQESHYQNFHLIFLLKLTKYLGVGVELSDPAFHSLSTDEVSAIRAFIKQPYDDWVTISNDSRRKILDLIIRFYKSHIDSLKEINSINILKEVL